MSWGTYLRVSLCNRTLQTIFHILFIPTYVLSTAYSISYAPFLHTLCYIQSLCSMPTPPYIPTLHVLTMPGFHSFRLPYSIRPCWYTYCHTFMHDLTAILLFLHTSMVPFSHTYVRTSVPLHTQPFVFRNLTLGASALTCYLHACRNQSEAKCRKYLARIIWMLTYDNEKVIYSTGSSSIK